MSILRVLTIIFITLLLQSSECTASRWRDVLSKKILSTTRGSRIAGGTEAARNQFPFAILLFNYHTDGSDTICSGSIISSIYALSAAHCFTLLRSADLLAGIHDVTLEYPLYELSIMLSDITSHFNFNNPIRANDIAIISTRRQPFSFLSPSIQPISMAPRIYVSANLTGYVARVAGWGITSDGGEMSSVPRFIDSPIITNTECAQTFGSLILASNFCLSGANGRSTCSGDSGGGVTIAVGNTRNLIGIVSFGSQFGCQSGYPTVKTRITAYYDWITTVTGITIP